MRNEFRFIVALLTMGILVCGSDVFAKKEVEVRLFGPTGIEGTLEKAALKVTGVQKGSPADGKVKAGDVVIGVGTAKFSKDLIRDMAKAIDDAETEATAGKMTLLLKGNKKVEITLPVLGSYSATAPYNCAKSDKIITMAAEALLNGKNSKKGPDGGLHPGVLGLLATGEKKYIDAAASIIKKSDWANPDPAKIEDILKGGPSGYVGWYWGYDLITLCEYHLLTGDKSVLPAIKLLAVALARGQDAAGLYGHRMVDPARFNRLRGYAQMNQPSLTCFMGMIMVTKCGIKDPVLDQGIAKTYAYVASHIGKGTFPYGVHGPNSAGFNNNGMSGSAAICMELMGNKEGAKFFSQCTATSFDELEEGHASNFFNGMWTPLGASRCGPEVTQQFFKKSLWYHNLRRNFDGSWLPDRKEGPHEGVALLTYCLPRKALLITGREADQSIWVKGQAATDVVMASKIDYKSKTPEELMSMATDHYLPQVRRRAGGALGEHWEKLEPTWVRYLKEGTPKQKKLALSQYGWWRPIEQRLPQLDTIGALLRDSNQPLDVKIAAVDAVAFMGEPARKYYPDIVKLLAIDNKPDDPFQLIDMGLGKYLNALCNTPFASGLVPDKELHYKAALRLVRHKRQQARTEGLAMLADLPLQDFHLVADDVLHVIADNDPTYHSYHNPSGPVAEAIGVLANLNIKEGIDLAMKIGDNPSGKGSFKAKGTWEALAKYGANAKDALKKYKERSENRTDWGRNTGEYNKMIKAIEDDKDPKPLITLEEAIKQGKQ